MNANLPGDWWPDWALFGDAIGTALLLAAVLPPLGALMLLRQQVFVTAAIGQAAGGGIALVLALGLASPHGHGDGEGRWILVGAALLAAIVPAVLALRTAPGLGSTLEARSACMFLLAGAGAMLLLANDPHGAMALQRSFLSSVLAADRHDVVLAAAALVALAALLWRRSRRVLAWAIDPAAAAVHGVPVGRYDAVGGMLFGAVVGHAITSVGLAFTFGAAVLPVLAARERCRTLRSTLLAAPVVGAVGAAAGCVLAHRFDLPPGQVAVALWAALALLARACRRRG
ncbi:MAG: metal ABC transporter permease [Planctomycetes bacterium]|nr:metal ABC transporter permease [Planctomycetota bacterium]